MISKEERSSRVLYRHHKIFTKIAYFVLIAVAVFTVGANIVLLYKTHQIIIATTNHHISELSRSLSIALDRRFQRTLAILESVALGCNQEKALSAEELAKLQKQAELFQFEYFARISPDGSAICSDGISRTFAGQDGIRKAFEGQMVIDAKDTGSNAQNAGMPFFMIPIYSNREAGEITGVLAAPFSPLRTNFFLNQSYYGDNVFLNIIKSDGTEVFMTKRFHAPQLNVPGGTNNLFDVLQANVETIADTTVEDIRQAAATGRNKTIRFRVPHSHLTQTARLTRIGNTDLCIWLVDTNDAISEGLDQLLHMAFWINGLVVICFGALICVLIFLYRKNTALLMVDPVTGGYSLSRFNQEAEYLLNCSTAGNYTFIVVNIVNFKIFNDAYGYYEGNRILKHVHDTMIKYLEDDEILTRSGGDDFNVLIHTTNDEVILRKLDLMVDEINHFNEELSEKQWIMFRVGVYHITDTDISVVHIRDRANIARKKMKIMNRDILYSCGFYEEEDRVRLQQEIIIKSKMNYALEHQDFKLYLQPKVDISTGRIVAAEALVRWKDADMGLVPPDEFIPLFERIGFIRWLDLYMFEQACACLRRWLDAGLQPVRISVNISRVHLTNKDFLLPFVEVQKNYRIPPELLELELTESAALDYPNAIPEAISKIHLAGYACSLDDFGSGYSSLNCLESLDIDIVKLDCKFLRAARAKNDRGHILIEELVHMAKRLGITVCCEGVETEEQFAFLQKCRCDMGQGYLFSRPIEVTAFEKMVYATS